MSKNCQFSKVLIAHIILYVFGKLVGNSFYHSSNCEDNFVSRVSRLLALPRETLGTRSTGKTPSPCASLHAILLVTSKE